MNFAQLMTMHPQVPSKGSASFGSTHTVPFNLNDGESFAFILNEMTEQGVTLDEYIDQFVKELGIDLSFTDDIKQLINSFLPTDTTPEGEVLFPGTMLDSLAESIVNYLTDQGEEITFEEALIALNNHLDEVLNFAIDQVPLDWQGLTNIIVSSANDVNTAAPLTDEQLTKMNQILQQFSTLIGEQVGEGNIKTLEKTAPEIVKLLNEWQGILDRTNLSKSDLKQLISENDLAKLWEKLTERFTKRTNVAKAAHYSGDAKVRSADVAKWLAHLLQESDLDVKLRPITTPKIQLTNATHPVINATPIEQYVIYTQQSKGELMEQQVLNQFRQIVETRNFFPYQTNINQLSVTLRPDHLGEIFVRMTEINGEMTVKLLVSSQATKRLLEANIHQLKHMFSPHQVVIEENEKMVEDLTPKDQLQEENNEENFNDTEEEEQQEQSSDTFTDDFQTILNEIV